MQTEIISVLGGHGQKFVLNELLGPKTPSALERSGGPAAGAISAGAVFDHFSSKKAEK